jgi:hypothetical protein
MCKELFKTHFVKHSNFPIFEVKYITRALCELQVSHRSFISHSSQSSSPLIEWRDLQAIQWLHQGLAEVPVLWMTPTYNFICLHYSPILP